MADRRRDVTYDTEESSRRALIEICVFLFFLIITTYIALTLQTIYTFYFNRNFDRLFTNRVSNQMSARVKFEEIATIDEFWSFLLGTFFINLRGNWKQTNVEQLDTPSTTTNATKKFKDGQQILFLEQNVVLEAPRLRQIRIHDEPCYQHTAFQHLYRKCYAPYTPANEFKEPVYKNTSFYVRSETNTEPFWGNLERYDGAGYVSRLTYDQAENEAIVTKLRESQWIDRASRLIMIELVVYNNNMDLFNNMKFVAEIMPVGGIVSYSYMEVAPLFSVWSGESLGKLACVLVFYLFIIFNTGNEISEIYQYGFKAYFQSVWNYLDWGIIFGAYVSLALSLLHGYFIDEYLEQVFSEQVNGLASIDKACFWFAAYVETMAAIAFFVWIRLFRFISFNKTMLAFSMALKQCAGDIFGFAIILFIVYMAFALLGLALFNTSDLDFSTFQYAYFFMMRLNLHDFEYSNFERADPFWGQLYFMCFIVIVVFLCFNMFLAIISQTYINVKKENIESHSEIKAVLIKLYRRMRDCCLKINKKFRRGATPRGDEPREDSPSEMPSIVGIQSKPSEFRVPKKLAFQDSFHSDDSIGKPTTSEASEPLSSNVAPLQMDEDEALKEFFGVDRGRRLKRSVSQQSFSTFATPESSYADEDEADYEDWDFEAETDDFDDDDDMDYITNPSRSVTEEPIEPLEPMESLQQKVDRLEKSIDQLSTDMDTLMFKIIEADKLKKAAQN